MNGAGSPCGSSACTGRALSRTALVEATVSRPNPARVERCAARRAGGPFTQGSALAAFDDGGRGRAGAGTYLYQLYFRNVAPGFCLPAGFNLSNGYRVAFP